MTQNSILKLKYRKPYSYDLDKYGSIISYDKYSFIIRGTRIFILGGEFHYWRLPDRDSWYDILTMYKNAGLNSVRIYFHWGYHSPEDGKYIFTENRDIEYLFSLCEQIGLYVLVAPGPYECAETSAGGFPGWLLSKQDVNLRHCKRTGFKQYDPKFRNYCEQWLKAFYTIMKPHQLTENPNGCVIGVQLENELIRKMILTFGLDREMEDLAYIARDAGITVPTFHNDAFPSGTWNGGKNPKNAAVDLYGFDRYLIWCPNKYYLKNGKVPKWSNASFSKKVDQTEKTIRKMGGWAAETPIFLPETQGGWYNNWGNDHGFDEIYDYYGDDYTKMVLDTFIGQGASMLSFYMFIGATNWGTIGDPDVITSYDYSACLREFRFISSRLRKFRLTALFLQSFANDILESEGCDLKTHPKCAIKSNIDHLFASHRHCRNGISLYLFRNFSKTQKSTFELVLPEGDRMNGTLNPRGSFFGVANYRYKHFELIFSSMPWIIKVPFQNTELWVFQFNEGELLIQGLNYMTFGDIFASTRGQRTHIRFKNPGFGRLLHEKGTEIFLMALSMEDSLTFNAMISEKDWQMAWGSYGIFFNNNRTLTIETLANKKEETVFYLGSGTPEGFTSSENEIIKTIQKRTFTTSVKPMKEQIPIEKWEKMTIDWNNQQFESAWKPINFETERNPLVHNFTLGHVVYRCIFTPTSSPLKIQLNIRHKAQLWLNGQCIGGHITYGYTPLSAGAKNGPDPSFLGKKTYDLSNNIKINEPNILIILTESLGYNRGPGGAINDFRNPRGILSMHFSKNVENVQWAISGIDTRTLLNPYNTTCLIGEKDAINKEGKGWEKINDKELNSHTQLTWFRASFILKLNEKMRQPFKIHIDGTHTAHIFVNSNYIGRYWGDFGPQHDFYIMDGFLNDGINDLVLAAYSKESTPFTISVEPYNIDLSSGNLKKEGPTFATQKFTIPL